ncbi:MAG: choice-of-anchor I family protein [Flavobacterium sp.]|jgi:hypothetical protein|uniref:choice-of-anchor I family protein n=1 Tax=Flavobacterium sp. TaxID=239 RepID=UPI0022C6860D|nr:choice-of-anchor I family protein [Flavobacterium sp.]MCZ8169042.1 choice-of-anchor I family protein [Flavobacterium sp.]MCZ8295978.1 choice-of-anchor I family protein [Flavobacterium sp.]
MRKNDFLQLLVLSLFLYVAPKASGQTLVHYWNFNDNSSLAALTTPSQTLGGAALVALPGGISTIDVSGGTGQNFNVQNLNAQNGDSSGTHLRFNDPIGGALVFSLPTTGYEAIVMRMATRRSNSGAGTQIWSYSTDGTTYTFLTNIAPNNGDPALATLDFSSIPGVTNNPNFKVKVEFAQGSGGTVGNNRFDNVTLQGTPFSGADMLPPNVTFFPQNNATNVALTAQPTLTFNEPIRFVNDTPIDNTSVDALLELRLNSATGTAVPFDATINGSVITVNPLTPFTVNQSYYLALLPNTVEDAANNAITTLQSITFTTGQPTLSFANSFVTVNENAGSITLNLTVTNPAAASVDWVVKTAPFSTADANDFTATSQTITLSSSSPATIAITVPIIDDSLAEQQAEYVVFRLENPQGVTLGANAWVTLYILDNDTPTPSLSQEIELNYLGSFDPSGTANNRTCEIIVHDPVTQRLFTTSAASGVLDIIDFSNPTQLSVIQTLDLNTYGGVTSVAVKNGLVAVACPNANEALNGSVVVFDTQGVFQKQFTVGALPDMITFTPDGTKILTANEGQPDSDYTVDPLGSVSIIDISGGIAQATQAQVTTLDFTAFNAQEAALLNAGVRKGKATSTLAQDLEPEYLAVHPDGTKAWVTLQENNAIAEINLTTPSITSIWPLGTKNIALPGNGFDVSDNNGQILIANWPLQAYYIPDAMAHYTVNGVSYLVTANEGDEREYNTLNERTTVGAATLDATAIPNAAVLKQNSNMGRFRITNLNGNTDADAELEQLYCVGSRSFSIFNAETQALVFDSGDQFERFTAANLPTLFNADHENNTPKGRSRAKGPEPEGVTIATLGTETFAFVSLERIGGVMVYNITNPAQPVLTDYKNSRSTSAYAGDHGPEGITYIQPENTTTGKPYILVANEISGTLTVFEIDTNGLGRPEWDTTALPFAVFPNPVGQDGVLYCNRAADCTIYTITGQKVGFYPQALVIPTQELAPGVYIVQTETGQSQKFIVK